MAGVYYEFIDYVDIEKRFYGDMKTYLIHNYDVYNVLENALTYPDNIIIE